MIRKLFQMKKGSFLRNVAIVASGTAMAQVIALLSSPIITRLYGPEAYGMMGIFQSLFIVLIPLAALSFPNAIVIPKKDEEAKGIMLISIYLSIIISILSLIIIFIFNKNIISLFNLQDIAPYIFLIPIVLLLGGLMQTYEQWLIRTKQFHITAKSTVYRSFIINSGRVGIGIYYPLASVLIVLTALENGIKLLIMRFNLKKMDFKISLKYYDIKKILNLTKTFKDFPIYRTPQIFLNNLSQNMPVLLLTIFFGVAATGFFAIGRTVLSVPSMLIGNAIGEVFYPRIAEANHKGENLNRLIIKATTAMVLAGIIPYGIIILFGPWLFSFVFGAEWIVAGEYARWMSIWIFLMFINNPSVKALPVMGAQAFQLKYAILTFVLRLVAFISAYFLYKDDLIAVATFSIVAGLLSIGLILITLKIGKEHQLKYENTLN